MTSVVFVWFHYILNSVYFISVQGELQQALLSLGEFQSAIDELMSWVDKTLTLINQPPSIYSDPKTTDIELKNIKVCQRKQIFAFIFQSKHYLKV